METHVVKYKFLHCNKQKKIIEQMYGNEFDNFTNNREKYLAFLNKVVADNRVEELNNILGNNDMNGKYYHNGHQGDKVVADNRIDMGKTYIIEFRRREQYDCACNCEVKSFAKAFDENTPLSEVVEWVKEQAGTGLMTTTFLPIRRY